VIVGFAPAGECHARGMVEIVVPQGIDPESSFTFRQQMCGALGFVLCKDHDAP
jgi:hypothetical protein